MVCIVGASSGDATGQDAIIAPTSSAARQEMETLYRNDGMNSFTYHAHSVEDTNRLAAALAEVVPDRTVVALHGTLGAGKTQLVRGLAAACGVPTDDVVSPTFVLCQEYRGRRTIHHLDAYRLRDEDEFLELGPEECFESDAITLVEWADRVSDCLPSQRLEVRIESIGETARRFEFIAIGGQYKRVVEQLVRALQCSEFGLVGTSQLLPPDSSKFQRALAMQLSRSQSPIVKTYIDSDMVTTQCCAVRRNVFEQLGGFHEGLLRGVDPEFRNRVRQLGLRVVVVPDAWHYHPVPSSVRALVRLAFRDGYSSAQVFRQHPEAVLFNPEGHAADFQAHYPVWGRYSRRLLDVVRKFVAGQWWGALYGLVYVAGYAWAVIVPPRRPDKHD